VLIFVRISGVVEKNEKNGVRRKLCP
jgi:hypothetical protein